LGHADSSALPISFVVDAAWCLSQPATSASKLSEKKFKVSKKDQVVASDLSVYSKASTPLLDEAKVQKQCKSGCGYTKFVHDIAFRRHEKTKNTAACWVFTFHADALAATDWLVALALPVGST
jgi:hypothetical protein